MMDPFLEGKCGYTTIHLKNKLLDHYGNNYFNELPESNTIASENGMKTRIQIPKKNN